MNFLKLQKIERTHSELGSSPKPTNADLKTYIALMDQWNARKSESLALASPISPLLKARAFYMRGRFELLRELLNKNLRNPEIGEKPEWLLEQARLFNAEANFRGAIEAVFLALESKPTLVTMLTLLQVRALAYYESNEFERCWHDLEMIESLEAEIPRNVSAFYAKVLKIKLAARTQGSARAKEYFFRCLNSECLNADKVLALVRAWIEIQTIDGKPAEWFAIACYHLSERLGDRLYQAFALVQIYYSLPEPLRQSLNTELDIAKQEFARVAKLCNALSVTSSPESTSPEKIILSVGVKLDFILLGNQHFYCFTNDITHFLEEGKIKSAIMIFSETEQVRKIKFFELLWGAQKYVPRLHDNLIWNLLSRLRKEHGFECSIENDTILVRSRILRLAL